MTASTHIETNAHLTFDDGSLLHDLTLYRQLVGSLVYLTVTHLDIAYVVHIVSQFMTSPRSSHFSVILCILQYIRDILYHGLLFSSHSSLVLHAYFDVDWAGDPTDRRSTIGFCFFLGNPLISWHSKKQTIVSQFSIKAEYRAIADATQELI
ncbi:hypothetical protein ACH5RR_008834 [Cinchona calisaya]|uniref:Mitochondrial protein n=1 Tax=Cinchona calisaya TaxID=153742 RepID=A0ABD3ACQ5_9GENT